MGIWAFGSFNKTRGALIKEREKKEKKTFHEQIIEKLLKRKQRKGNSFMPLRYRVFVHIKRVLHVCSELPAPVLLRSGSHIVNQSKLRQGTVIKLGRAMWKRHRALNALAGDNMSAMQLDHMGAPSPTPWVLGMPAAELCHLVNERGGTAKRGQVNESMSGTAVCPLLLHTRGTEGV